MKLNRHHLVSENTAFARSSLIKSSVQKVNLVAGLVRNLAVHKALLQLQFSRKKVARDLLDVLNSAVANAENNYGMNVDKLYVSEVLVNKAITLKRMKAKAKGRGGKIQKHYSKIVVFVSVPVENKELNKAKST